jgi:hypothetical protein
MCLAQGWFGGGKKRTRQSEKKSQLLSFFCVCFIFHRGEATICRFCRALFVDFLHCGRLGLIRARYFLACMQGRPCFSTCVGRRAVGIVSGCAAAAGTGRAGRRARACGNAPWKEFVSSESRRSLACKDTSVATHPSCMCVRMPREHGALLLQAKHAPSLMAHHMFLPLLSACI